MINKENALKNIKLFVLDMDGTFYLGNKIIDGAKAFIMELDASQRDFVFFTNNSSKTPAFYEKKLKGMDCTVPEEKILTSGDVTIKYLKDYYPGNKVYILATPIVKEYFQSSGIDIVEEDPDVVLLTFDMTLTYEKLENACRYIDQGAVYLATHPDANCPTENGFIPDCGSFIALIKKSTGKEPYTIGKPNSQVVDMIEIMYSLERENIAFVGDRLYTDIATGVINGSNGIMVLTGEATMDDVEKSYIKPTAIYESLKEMIDYL